MEGFIIEMEVSVRDCARFREFLKDTNIADIYDFEMEQVSTNFWLLKSADYLPDYEVQEIINELEEVCEGFEVDFVAEY